MNKWSLPALLVLWTAAACRQASPPPLASPPVQAEPSAVGQAGPAPVIPSNAAMPPAAPTAKAITTSAPSPAETAAITRDVNQRFVSACKDADAAVASSKSGDFAGALSAGGRAAASLDWITETHPESDLAVKIASGETRVASMTSSAFKSEFIPTLKRQLDAATNPIVLAWLLAEHIESKLDRCKALGDVANSLLQANLKEAAHEAASNAMRLAKDVFATDPTERSSRIQALSEAMAVVADSGHADEARSQLGLLKNWLSELGERRHDSSTDAIIYSMAVERSFPALVSLGEYDLTSTLVLSVAGSSDNSYRVTQYRLAEKLAQHGQLARALALMAAMPTDKMTQELFESFLDSFQEAGDAAIVAQIASAAMTFCLGTLTCGPDEPCAESCVEMLAPHAKDIPAVTSLAALLRRGTATGLGHTRAIGGIASAYARVGAKEQCVAALADAEGTVRLLPEDERLSALVTLAEAMVSCGSQPEAALTSFHRALKKNASESTYEELTVLVQMKRLQLAEKAKEMAAEFSTAAHTPQDGEESDASHIELAELALAIDDQSLASTEISHTFTPTPGTRETDSRSLVEISDICAKAHLWKESLDAALSISERGMRVAQVAEVGLQLHRSHATLPTPALDIMRAALLMNSH